MAENKKYRIFSLGTNNWQGQGEFAPGSGILHKTHHDIFNKMENVESYSMWPSKTQKTLEGATDYKVFELDHDIPICESYSPNSSYRWHSMSGEEVENYFANLYNNSEKFINEIENEKGEVNLFLAHHTFMNPIAMTAINKERIKTGKQRVPLGVFAHGTAMKMYYNELEGLEEFQSRSFYDAMVKSGIFDPDNKYVDVVFTISNEEKENFMRLFPKYDEENIVVSGNGYNTDIFKRFDKRPSLGNALEGIVSAVDGKPLEGLERFDKSVIFTGKYADWKRLKQFLDATSKYEKALKENNGLNVATIIAGTGPDEKTRNFYYSHAKSLGLKNTFFIGSQDQQTLAKINNAVDLGVFPSKKEPFGLVFIEAMASGTPVIGANSGGPMDFVNEEVGYLIPETDNDEVLAENISNTVKTALIEDWKTTKGPIAAKYALENFTPEAQCKQILDEVSKRV
jgi:glycosyltransferase involved in cell wall biosynthesis